MKNNEVKNYKVVFQPVVNSHLKIIIEYKSFFDALIALEAMSEVVGAMHQEGMTNEFHIGEIFKRCSEQWVWVDYENL